MKLIPVWADLETRSECCLKTHGVHRYAEHPSTRIQLFSWAVGDGSTKLWSKEDGEPIPLELVELFRNPQYIFIFHNAWFDRNLIEHDEDLIAAIGFVPPITRYRCTMAMALAHGLPGGLDKLGEALAIPVDARKHKDGKRLVQMFCKPRKQKDGSLKWATPETHSEDWAKYKEYCLQDTTAMREIYRKIPKWNYRGDDLEYWFMDQKVNSRGMQVDTELVDISVQAIAEEQAYLAIKTKDATGDLVSSAAQRDALLAFIRENYDADIPDLRKATVQSLIDSEECNPQLRDLLQIRLDTSTTSTAKYKRIKNVVSADGRVRGTIQFAGASRTERDGGRLTQPQNYARPKMKHKPILEGIKALKGGYARLIGEDIMKLTSSALRYTIIAKPGCKLVVADLANIEGRALAWLAGEEWKLQAFRDFDAGVGVDLYKAAYGKAFSIDPSAIGDEDVERQIGKILELSMGYQGSVGAFVSFATIYGVDLEDLANRLQKSVPPKVLAEAESFYEWLDSKDIEAAKEKAVKEGGDWRAHYAPKSTLSLPIEVYAPIDALKRLWRTSHPAIVGFWGECEQAVRAAVNCPSVPFYFGNPNIENRMYAIRTGKWTRIVLPSGHSVPYPAMEIDKHGKLRYKGVDGFSKKWQWIYTFGGKICENLTQAISRDIFKYGELAAERAGYSIILPVHDELVSEVPDYLEYSIKEMSSIMAANPLWAPDIPLAAKGFEDYCYHK